MGGAGVRGGGGGRSRGKGEEGGGRMGINIPQRRGYSHTTALNANHDRCIDHPPALQHMTMLLCVHVCVFVCVYVR